MKTFVTLAGIICAFVAFVASIVMIVSQAVTPIERRK